QAAGRRLAHGAGGHAGQPVLQPERRRPPVRAEGAPQVPPRPEAPRRGAAAAERLPRPGRGPRPHLRRGPERPGPEGPDRVPQDAMTAAAKRLARKETPCPRVPSLAAWMISLNAWMFC